MKQKFSKRSYKQACSLARALDLIGERWTMLILKEFFAGPRRFKDLLVNLDGIGSNLLSQRLKQLKEFGIIEDFRLPAPASVLAIRLTPLGSKLEKSLIELARWGLNFTQPKSTSESWSPMWNHIAFKAGFNEKKAEKISGSLCFSIDGYEHFLQVKKGHLITGEGILDDPDAFVRTSNESFIDWVEGRLDLTEAMKNQLICVEGDLKQFALILEVFNS